MGTNSFGACELHCCEDVNANDPTKCDKCGESPSENRRCAMTFDTSLCFNICPPGYTSSYDKDFPDCWPICEDNQFMDKGVCKNCTIEVDPFCTACGVNTDGELKCTTCKSPYNLSTLNETCTTCSALEFENLPSGECETCYKQPETPWCSTCFERGDGELKCQSCPTGNGGIAMITSPEGRCTCPDNTSFPTKASTYDETECALCATATGYDNCLECTWDPSSMVNGVTSCTKCSTDKWLDETAHCVDESCKTFNGYACIACNERTTSASNEKSSDGVSRWWLKMGECVDVCGTDWKNTEVYDEATGSTIYKCVADCPEGENIVITNESTMALSNTCTACPTGCDKCWTENKCYKCKDDALDCTLDCAGFPMTIADTQYTLEIGGEDALVGTG
jgi:hypothetical protein